MSTLRFLFGVQASLFWTAVNLLVFTFAAFAVLLFLREVGSLVRRLWLETAMSWWADRHARQMRQRIAEVEREMETERQQQRLKAISQMGPR